MKKIVLICFGKLKIPGLEDSFTEYSKRITRYTDFKVLELKPVKIEEKSKTLRDQIPEKEAEMILDLIDAPAFKQKEIRSPVIWVLDETGSSMKTTDWAKQFESIQEKHGGELLLILGGSLGLGDAILKRANRKISFGAQTFSHELARVVLVEQVYRALSLMAGHPYHNEG